MPKVKRSTEFIVGIVTIVAIVTLLFGIFWFKQYSFTTNNRVVTFIVNDTGNLDPDDPVLVNGVRVGKVKDIRIKGEKTGNKYLSKGAIVEIWLDSSVFLPEDTIFRIDSFGIMGERFVSIITGTSDKEMDYSKPARGITSSGLPEIMAGVGDVYAHIHKVLSEVNAVIDSIAGDENQKSLKRSLANLENLTKDLQKLTTNNSQSLEVAINNFKSASISLQELVDNNKDKINKSVNDFNSASSKLEFLSANMETLSVSLKNITEQLEKGDGTASKLLNDKELYDDLKRTTKNLDELIQDIKTNPKKYISIKIF